MNVVDYLTIRLTHFKREASRHPEQKCCYEKLISETRRSLQMLRGARQKAQPPDFYAILQLERPSGEAAALLAAQCRQKDAVIKMLGRAASNREPPR